MALDPSDMLRLFATEMDRLKDEKQPEAKDAERRTHMVDVGVPKVVGALIYRTELNGDPQTGQLMSALFARALEWLAPLTDNEEAVTTVFKMLNADLRFYEVPESSKKYFNARNEDVALEFVDPRAPLISAYYLRAVNAFCKLKGFEVYRERLARTEPTRVPLPCMRMMLRVLLKVAPYVKPEHVHEQVARLKVRVVKCGFCPTSCSRLISRTRAWKCWPTTRRTAATTRARSTSRPARRPWRCWGCTLPSRS